MTLTHALSEKYAKMLTCRLKYALDNTLTLTAGALIIYGSPTLLTPTGKEDNGAEKTRGGWGGGGR